MDIIEKFYADVKRITKYDRANNAGSYDGIRASKQISKHFTSLYKDLGELPFYISDYWEKTYIAPSVDPNNEPSEKNIIWLAAIIALFEGDFFENASEAEKNALSKDDWKEICTLVNCEADDMPLEILTSLMSVFTEKKVL